MMMMRRMRMMMIRMMIMMRLRLMMRMRTMGVMMLIYRILLTGCVDIAC